MIVKRRLTGTQADVIAVASLVLVTIAVTLWWIHPDVNSFTIQTHGDQVWVQASAQIGMQSGPFATNLHSGWASGFDPWAYPTGGAIGFFSAAWLLGLLESSSSNVLAAIMAGTAAAVAVCTYFAVRFAASRSVLRLVAWLGAVTIGLSPYVLSKMGHYNVAAFYLLPLLIAALGYLRSRRSRGQIALTMGAVALASLVSPLWWTFVSLYFLALGLLVSALLRDLRWLRNLALTAFAVLIGGALPIGLSLTHSVGADTWNRQPWDSTIYSGSLTDFILGSPLLNTVFPKLESLLPATSRELSVVGLVPSIAAVAAIVISLTAYLRFAPDDRKNAGWLFVLLQMTLLTFVTLGLGTTQEALLSLVGIESPLRGWSRLTILVALLGLILVSPWISDRITSLRPSFGRAARIALIVVVLGAVLADARSLVMAPPRGLPTVEEVAPVAYLESTVGNCPVAQLPVGSFPDFPMADGSEAALSHYYRGFVPYLLNPEGNWSFGAALGTESDTFMRSLPSTVSTDELLALRSAGYCAVLYDNEYAAWLRGRNLDWPAQDVSGLTPTWSAQRFDVYVLS